MRLMLILVGVLFFSSCTVVDSGVELGKTIWGSTTRVLEQARANALAKTYDKGYWDCIRASLDVIEKQGYVIFKKDEIKGYIVLMGIHGAVNTTEVGVFFVELSDTQTRVELSSLSTHAKRIAAKALFHGLDISFGLVPPDPVEDIPVKEDKK